MNFPRRNNAVSSLSRLKSSKNQCSCFLLPAELFISYWAVEAGETLLQRETGRLVRNLAAVGLSLYAVVVVVYGLTRGNWLNGFLAGTTMAMATLPEELPVVLTVFLALGAWRISQKRVLTRRVPAVETLGSATVLCVDKTGTLTQNRIARCT
ncbi:MAG: Calcium-transporting ATPase 1 [Pelotomaculum sp. PtaB.Bin013]|nr:MAG: Calcium-transporting ATPase 1 [Pelotomaculum sp. PtaB.Bin013]